MNGWASLKPGSLPASHQVKMQVEHVLASSPLHIEDQSITRLVNPLIPGDLAGPEEHLSEKGAILLLQVVDAADVFSGHQKDVNRRVRLDVMKGDQVIVLIDLIRGLPPLNDFAENATLFHDSSIRNSGCGGAENSGMSERFGIVPALGWLVQGAHFKAFPGLTSVRGWPMVDEIVPGGGRGANIWSGGKALFGTTHPGVPGTRGSSKE
jgi:hypothetical protein